jgi:hypothetical protein
MVQRIEVAAQRLHIRGYYVPQNGKWVKPHDLTILCAMSL